MTTHPHKTQDDLSHAFGLMAGPLVSGAFVQVLGAPPAFMHLVVGMICAGFAVILRLPTMFVSRPMRREG